MTQTTRQHDRRGLMALAAQASAPALELARAVLAQDFSDREWAEQIGPALSQSDVALLLGVSEQSVSKSRRLVRVRNRDGRPVYPVMQFDGRRVLPGVPEVVETLSPVLVPLTIASWLTAPHRDLDDVMPADALRSGELDRVVTLAHQLAGTVG